MIFAHLAVPEFAGGFVGVDIFFVISGYLITSLLLAEYAERAAANSGYGSISIPQFYLRRARRILPAAVVVIVAVDVASRTLFNPLREAQVSHDVIWALIFASNINFIHQATNYFSQGAAVSPLQHYWSLAVEEQFYLIWPALFLLATKFHGLKIARVRVGWQARIAGVIAVGGTVSLIWSLRATSVDPVSAYFSTFTRAWELALGAAVAVATLRRGDLSRRLTVPCSYAGAGLLVLACIMIDASTPFPGYAALLPTLGAALLILGGMSARRPAANRVLGVPPLRFIGRISYSLYLWHWPLIVFGAALFPASSSSVSFRLAVFAMTLVVATASFYLIEQPGRRAGLSFNNTAKHSSHKRSRVPTPFLGNSPRLGALGFGLCFATAAIVIGLAPVYLSRTQHTSFSSPRDLVAASAPLGASVHATTVASGAAGHGSTSRHRTSTTPIVQRTSIAAATGSDYDQMVRSWQEKVRAGLAVRSLPATLQPLSAHLVNVATPCNNYRLAIVHHEADCEWGNSHAKNVAVITGDSHAGMWLTTLEGALNPHTWVLHPFTRSWCGWAGGSDNIAPQYDAENADCHALQAQTVQSVKRLHPDLLILSEAGPRSQAEMTSALGALTPFAKHVVVLGYTPQVVPNFENCLSGSSGVASCQGTLSPTDLADMALERQTIALFNDAFVDTTQWFCFNSSCPSVVDGEPVFTDGSHITAAFAPKLVPLLRASLEARGALTPAGEAP